MLAACVPPTVVSTLDQINSSKPWMLPALRVKRPALPSLPFIYAGTVTSILHKAGPVAHSYNSAAAPFLFATSPLSPSRTIFRIQSGGSESTASHYSTSAASPAAPSILWFFITQPR